MAQIGSDIDFAIELLNRQELIGIPTETVYGLAGNALNATTVAKIFKVKSRPTFDPLIVHAASMEGIKDLVKEIPDKAIELASHYWPGPLTLILNKKSTIPDLVTSGLDTVAVRVPNHSMTLELLQGLDFPLAAPSANPFGYVSPTKAQHVNEQLGEKISFILDGGDCSIGIESTIVKVEGDDVTVLRLGGCSVESIQSVVGPIVVNTISNTNPDAPGMLDSHYSPLTPLKVGNIDKMAEKYQDLKLGVLSFNNLVNTIDRNRQFVLSKKSDLNEAATRLFTGLRHLDNLNLQLILSEYVPDQDLGLAINDRLKRAQSNRQ